MAMFTAPHLLLNWWGHLLAPAWAGALWRACWQGGLALLIIWALCRAWPAMPARLREWLWRLGYLKLLLSWLYAGALTVTLLPAAITPLPAPVALPSPPPSSVTAATAPTTSTLAVERISSREPAAATASAPVASTPHISPPSAAASPTCFHLPTLLPVLFSLWLLGVAAGLLRLLLAVRHVRRLRYESYMVDDESVLRLRVQVVKQMRLRRAPMLLAHPSAGPLLLGIRHPVIIIPEAMLIGDGEELRLALAHELAHVRRRDILWGWLPALAELLFFFHPLLYPARRECRLAQEIACDAEAIARTDASPRAYGAMLLNGATHDAAFRTVPIALGIFESFHTLQRRLNAMSFLYMPVSRRRIIYAFIICSLALLGLLPWRLAADTTSANSPSNLPLDAQLLEKCSAGITLDHMPALIPQATDNICYCRVSPDGTHMVTWGGCHAYIWNMSNGVIENHLDGIVYPDDAIFSPDGRYLIFISLRRGLFPAVVWDVQHGITLHTWDENIRFARFTPDGKQIWTCCAENTELSAPEHDTLILRNVADGKVVRTVPRLTGMVQDVSSDGTKAISQETNGELIVRTINSGQQLMRLPGGWRSQAVFSPGSNTVIASWTGNGIDFWNCQTGSKMQTLPADAPFVFSPDGKRLACITGNHTMIWDVQTSRVIQTLPTSTSQQSRNFRPPVLEFTHDGADLLTNDFDKTGYPTGPIYRWDIATGRLRRTYETPEKFNYLMGVAITANRKLLAMGSEENSIALWNLAAGRIEKELSLPVNCWTNSLSFSPDGTMLAASLITKGGNSPSHIMVWDTRTGAVIKKDLPMPANTANIIELAFSPDGKRLFATNRGLQTSQVVIWNTADWSILQKVETLGSLEGFTLSPDGRWLSWITWVYSNNPHVNVYIVYSSLITLELATGKTREIIRTHDEDETLRDLSYSPDSRLLETYSGKARKQESIFIFDAATGQKKTSFQAKTAWLDIYGFTPDSSALIGKDSHGLFTVWDANTGDLKLSRMLAQSLYYLRFSDGGKTALGINNYSIQLWDTKQLLSEENPLPHATFNWFDGGKWLITTSLGYFDCSPELKGALAWRYAGKMYPYQQFAQQYHKPELVRQALTW